MGPVASKWSVKNARKVVQLTRGSLTLNATQFQPARRSPRVFHEKRRPHLQHSTFWGGTTAFLPRAESFGSATNWRLAMAGQTISTTARRAIQDLVSNCRGQEGGNGHLAIVGANKGGTFTSRHDKLHRYITLSHSPCYIRRYYLPGIVCQVWMTAFPRTHVARIVELTVSSIEPNIYSFFPNLYLACRLCCLR